MLAAVVMVEVERIMRDQTSVERRYFISSRKRLTAKTALSTVRAHWGLENGLHRVLDLAFREDECRVRAGNVAENFAVLIRNPPKERRIGDALRLGGVLVVE